MPPPRRSRRRSSGKKSRKRSPRSRRKSRQGSRKRSSLRRYGSPTYDCVVRDVGTVNANAICGTRKTVIIAQTILDKNVAEFAIDLANKSPNECYVIAVTPPYNDKPREIKDFDFVSYVRDHVTNKQCKVTVMNIDGEGRPQHLSPDVHESVYRQDYPELSYTPKVKFDSFKVRIVDKILRNEIDVTRREIDGKSFRDHLLEFVSKHVVEIKEDEITGEVRKPYDKDGNPRKGIDTYLRQYRSDVKNLQNLALRLAIQIVDGDWDNVRSRRFHKDDLKSVIQEFESFKKVFVNEDESYKPDSERDNQYVWAVLVNSKNSLANEHQRLQSLLYLWDSPSTTISDLASIWPLLRYVYESGKPKIDDGRRPVSEIQRNLKWAKTFTVPQHDDFHVITDWEVDDLGAIRTLIQRGVQKTNLNLYGVKDHFDEKNSILNAVVERYNKFATVRGGPTAMVNTMELLPHYENNDSHWSDLANTAEFINKIKEHASETLKLTSETPHEDLSVEQLRQLQQIVPSFAVQNDQTVTAILHRPQNSEFSIIKGLIVTPAK